MSAETLTRILKDLTQARPNELHRVESVLAAAFQQTKTNPHWTFYQCAIPTGPFASGEFRLNKAGDQALLSLEPREAVQEADLDLDQWGEVVNIDVNPRIPPEGTDAYTYNVQGVQVSFQLLHHSRRLRTVALAWEQAPETA